LGTTPQFGSTPRHPHSVLGGSKEFKHLGSDKGEPGEKKTRMTTRMRAMAVVVQEETEDDDYDDSSDDNSCMLGMSPDVAEHGFSSFGAQHAEVSARR